MTTTVKTILILETSKDWDEWYEIIRSIAKAKGVLPFTDVDVTAPQQLQEPDEPQYTHVKAGAVSFAALATAEQEHYKIFMCQPNFLAVACVSLIFLMLPAYSTLLIVYLNMLDFSFKIKTTTFCSITQSRACSTSCKNTVQSSTGSRREKRRWLR
jgi:hypothetical protein